MEAPHKLQHGKKRGDLKAILRKPGAFDCVLKGLRCEDFYSRNALRYASLRKDYHRSDEAEPSKDEAEPSKTVGHMRPVPSRLRGRPRIH